MLSISIAFVALLGLTTVVLGTIDKKFEEARAEVDL